MVQDPDSLVSIPVDDVELEGVLEMPPDASGIVVFAHGSGSSRKSPRNNFVADVIRDRGLATVLFDLLTEAEDQYRENRFDISLLTDRLVAVTEWLWNREETRSANVGYFGSSTGAAAALCGPRVSRTTSTPWSPAAGAWTWLRRCSPTFGHRRCLSSVGPTHRFSNATARPASS